MQLTKTLLFALVGTAFASPIEKRQLSVIQGAVTSVQGALTKLNTAVQGVGNDVASAQPILAASTEVQNTLSKAATDIQGAQPLQLQEALGLQQTATDLTSSATTLIDTLVSKKPNFDQIGVSSVVLQNLQQQKTASASLGTAIVSKVPAIGQGIAQQSIDQITAALDKGIQAYSAGGAAPAGAKPATNTTAPPAAAPAKPKTPAAAPAAPKTPAAAPKAPAGGLEGLLGGLLGGGAGGAGGAAGAGGLGALLGGLTGGAAGGAAGAGGAGGIGALLGGLTGGAAGGATTKANVVDLAEDAAEEDEE
ncbi:hypothetical protein HER10_EVM0012768 [Colletotrichum scovillei]|uniref:Cell wall mannoprotein 1 n=3 Tax=Colletotrichum acutatum species complex TaxID=2707335 RepID=A0A9P7R572_9PEZI|nr:uncharacterized protein HER10_EVM0012768 [Colletotrichum scovillei]KXH25590.1 hypothetical protein CNYM01_00371 [Colletotrichum nymphaeae SA-01]KXH35666.1 hypothetical protein CSIM01_05060 [Colletotrichum simmondsii]KAF4786035.1 hypothetical protein HER10_EVM0012768 [Colletotrichum scovillei]KAG7048031.1 cell wall protein [Colletotrichum scovillei]KAG7065196.1 cell wall protein [Colletotrichum scovillei]